MKMCMYASYKRKQSKLFIWITLWLFNMAMGNGLFIDGLPIKNGDFPWQAVK